ncbi:putative phage tail assembly chaperone [Shewanella algae]|uniref:putative phage tail assembly chaperone n=1 Tax=Shewanella algae TaxID=38313 RepID=UPI0031F4AF09
MKKTITLTIAGMDISFNMTTADYNNYINEVMPDNKVAPAHNLAVRTVSDEGKEPLKKLLEQHPGLEVQLAAKLAQDFAPMVEISVKK